MPSSSPFIWPVRVYYEDTDAAGVVYYANYLKYLERARTEWLRGFGIEQEALFQATGVRFAIAKVEIVYAMPARLDDLLEVTVMLTHLGGASLILEQMVRLQNNQKNLVRAMVRIAAIDPQFKPTRLPKKIVTLLETK
ncbi:MAG: tol-pal system-associated acyl-CoA thioesterase [Magnetococcus sp. DMHC-6]